MGHARTLHRRSPMTSKKNPKKAKKEVKRLGPLIIADMTPNDRAVFQTQFWGRVTKIDGECWHWNGAQTKATLTYGTVWFRQRTMRAHRAAYEITHGPIPAGKV